MLEKKPPSVIFLKEKSVIVKNDESILDASLRAGIPHYHVCGGKAECSTCRILIIDGFENLSEPTKKESKLKTKLGLHDDIRLACQTRVLREPVTINRIVRDISDVEIILNEEPNQGTQQIGEERE
ncbi:MAG: (2Fe-2S)-binding protein, partial [Pyrinomonadaceae bacterium]|nr:(2Fe-2S)-binding protein [Sphingobacteriaceae bacterium]